MVDGAPDGAICRGKHMTTCDDANDGRNCRTEKLIAKVIIVIAVETTPAGSMQTAAGFCVALAGHTTSRVLMGILPLAIYVVQNSARRQCQRTVFTVPSRRGPVNSS